MAQALERLGVSLPSLVTYLINFGILLGILYLVAYRPFLRAVDRRKERELAHEEKAAAAEKSAQLRQEEAEAAIERARERALSILAEARKTARADAEGARQIADRTARSYVTRARRSVEAERTAMERDLRDRVADLVRSATEAVLTGALDEDGHRLVIDQAIDSLEASGWKLPPNSPPIAHVTVATPPNDDQVERLAKLIAERSHRQVSMVVVIDRDVLGGLAVALGDSLVDNTLRGRLNRLDSKIRSSP